MQSSIVDSWEDLVEIKPQALTNINTTNTTNINSNNINKQVFRGPIVVILGQVDAGKTSLLDKIRQSNVQNKEVGGITQQIGATTLSRNYIVSQCKRFDSNKQFNIQIPNIIVLDTPGHDSFVNLRKRGVLLCDLAVIIIDIKHGMNTRIKECLNLLKEYKIPFIIALNKIDSLYNWNSQDWNPIQQSLKGQIKLVIQEFNTQVYQLITDMARENISCDLYYNLKLNDFRNTVSIVPLSARTGEGIPDLLLLIMKLSENLLKNKLIINNNNTNNNFKCSILDVKKLDGLGSVLDVILINGILSVGDQIMIPSNSNVPIVTRIKSLLLPPTNMESKVNTQYTKHKSLQGSICCKIVASNLDNSVGTGPVYLIKDTYDIEYYQNKIISDSKDFINSLISNGGVSVQSSTQGTLESLLIFLNEQCNIPVANTNIGPISRKDVMKASTMLKYKQEYGVLISFDVKITQEAITEANKLGVKIISGNIMHDLETQYLIYLQEIKDAKQKLINQNKILPCMLQINTCYRNSNPIIISVKVIKGILELNTPLCVTTKDFIEIGKITGIKNSQQKDITQALVNDDVSIEITPDTNSKVYTFNRHFNSTDKLVSKITRESINHLKDNFKEIISQREIYNLIKELKKLFDII